MKRQGPPDRPTRAMDASPQTGKGHGHTEVSNELLEAVYRFPFTAAQLRVLLFVFRDSYGWKRKETRAYTFTQIEVEVGLPRCTASRAFSELKGLGVVEPSADGGFAPVKNYNAWGRTPSLPITNVPLALISASERSTGAKKVFTGANSLSASGTLIGEIKLKKKERGADARPSLQVLPNDKNDTPRNRAALGHEDYAPEDHADFKRLSFNRQDELTAEWKESQAREAKKIACKKGCGRARASDRWPYCRPCTVCETCRSALDGKLTFTVVDRAIVCSSCK